MTVESINMNQIKKSVQIKKLSVQYVLICASSVFCLDDYISRILLINVRRARMSNTDLCSTMCMLFIFITFCVLVFGIIELISRFFVQLRYYLQHSRLFATDPALFTD